MVCKFQTRLQPWKSISAIYSVITTLSVVIIDRNYRLKVYIVVFVVIILNIKYFVLLLCSMLHSIYYQEKNGKYRIYTYINEIKNKKKQCRKQIHSPYQFLSKQDAIDATPQWLRDNGIMDDSSEPMDVECEEEVIQEVEENSIEALTLHYQQSLVTSTTINKDITEYATAAYANKIVKPIEDTIKAVINHIAPKLTENEKHKIGNYALERAFESSTSDSSSFCHDISEHRIPESGVGTGILQVIQQKINDTLANKDSIGRNINNHEKKIEQLNYLSLIVQGMEKEGLHVTRHIVSDWLEQEVSK